MKTFNTKKIKLKKQTAFSFFFHKKISSLSKGSKPLEKKSLIGIQANQNVLQSIANPELNIHEENHLSIVRSNDSFSAILDSNNLDSPHSYHPFSGNKAGNQNYIINSLGLVILKG